MPAPIQNHDGPVSHRCMDCGGAAHPSTGCYFAETAVLCWRCSLDNARWLARFTNGKGLKKGLRFYDHVSQSGPAAELAERLLEPATGPLAASGSSQTPVGTSSSPADLTKAL